MILVGMDTVIFILKQFVIILIDVLHLGMLIRAILSWIDPMQEWRISTFLQLLTEPVILPVRRLCERMRWFEGMPLDIPFLITWLLLAVIQTVVSVL
jgi:uncharacterized protein YggT (Ycf19 family)